MSPSFMKDVLAPGPWLLVMDELDMARWGMFLKTTISLRDRAARVKGGWRFRGPEMLSTNRSGDRKHGTFCPQPQPPWPGFAPGREVRIQGRGTFMGGSWTMNWTSSQGEGAGVSV